MWEHELANSMTEVCGYPVTVTTFNSFAAENVEQTMVIVRNQSTNIATFCLRRINKILGFSCKLWVAQELRGKGLYKILHKAKLALAIEKGYYALLATVLEDNIQELHCAYKSGFFPMTLVPAKTKGKKVYLMILYITSPAIWNGFCGAEDYPV